MPATEEIAAPNAPRKRDKNRRKEALIDAAIAVFNESPYDAATTREIADRAGCSEALIYRYFGDKQGLFREAVRKTGADNVLTKELDVGRAPHQSVEQYLADLMQTTLEVYLSGHFAGGRNFVLREAMQDRQLARRAVLPNHRRRIAGISEAIRRFQDDGQVDPDVDTEAVAEMVTGLTNYLGLMAPALYGTTRKRTRELATTVAHVIALGLRPAIDERPITSADSAPTMGARQGGGPRSRQSSNGLRAGARPH